MFIVLEIQSTAESSSVITNTYQDGADAENKYHTILAYAAKSQVPVHSAVMLNEMGTQIKNEYYIHRQEPEEVTKDEGLAD